MLLEFIALLFIALLEDAPEPSRHAADVVCVTSGIGLYPFTAAPREADFKDSLSAKSKRSAYADELWGQNLSNFEVWPQRVTIAFGTCKYEF